MKKRKKGREEGNKKRKVKKLRGSKRRIRAQREDDKLDGEEGRC